ncbi:MAG: DUF4293 domain-containing protein [Candidatus Cyclobacteriaceae bacterium M3_2C_046]
MWQRLQTVFLGLVALSMLLMLFFPIWLKANPNTNEAYLIMAFYAKHYTLEGEMVIEYFPFLFVGSLAIISVLLAIYEITRYKDRLTQMKIGALNSLIMAGALGLSVYFMIDAEETWMPLIRGEYKIGLFLPAIAMVFNTLANRFIRKDENLVRSVDRIR